MKSPKVFISYSRADEPYARKAFEQLKEARLDPWFDKEKLLPGQKWEIEIRKTIRDSDFVLLLLSSAAVSKRGFYQKEIKLALDACTEVSSDEIFLLLARLDDCDIPFELREYQYVDLFADWGLGFNSIIEAIESSGEVQVKSQEPARPPGASQRPYPYEQEVRAKIMAKFGIDDPNVVQKLILRTTEILQLSDQEAMDFLLAIWQ